MTLHICIWNEKQNNLRSCSVRSKTIIYNKEISNIFSFMRLCTSHRKD